jgi:hypothetical protein
MNVLFVGLFQKLPNRKVADGPSYAKKGGYVLTMMIIQSRLR